MIALILAIYCKDDADQNDDDHDDGEDYKQLKTAFPKAQLHAL